MSSVKREPEARTWWRSLDELADAPRFRAFLEAEFPSEADPGGISRRRWLQLMGASLALAGAAGCRWEKQEIRPFAERPDDRTPGKLRRFATAMPLGDSAIGLEVTTVDGRPIKIEGNPRHPQSLGATDVFAQAAILELYDPDRSRGVYLRAGKKEAETTWENFERTARTHFGKLREAHGRGFCVLAEASSSPTLDSLRLGLSEALPAAGWYEFDPIGDDNERAGATMAFGKPVRTHLALDIARVILCLDADPLGSHPAAVHYARDFAAGREPSAESMNRLYVVESCLSLSGAAADHRLPLRSTQIPAFLAMLLRELSGDGDDGSGEKSGNRVRGFARAVAKDLLEHRGRGVVCIGPGQPPEAHAAVYRINALLDNVGRDKTVTYTQVPHHQRPSHVEAIETLVKEINGGNVHTLLILGGNPVYNAPADLAFADALKKVETTIHLSPYRDETSRVCAWHLPRAHFLESWGDVRSYDGTYSVIQPTIAPLFGGRSAIEVLAMILDRVAATTEPETTAEKLVQRTFFEIAGDQRVSWHRALRDGLLDQVDTRWPLDPVSDPRRVELPDSVSEEEPENGSLEVVFRRAASVYDGRFANNSWLQELPNPLTRLTWDNAALVGPATAEKLDIENETLVRLKVGNRPPMRIPAYVMPGMAKGTVAVSLGYGRTAAGTVGGDSADGVEPVGVDVYPLRTTGAMTIATGVTLEPTGVRYPLASTQDHHAIDSVGRSGREKRLGRLIHQKTLAQHEDPESDEHGPSHALKSLWQEHEFQFSRCRGHRWGMSIDLSKCTGCGACVIACQAENNIPVVGKEQVRLGREMHWLRVDRYFRRKVDDPEVDDFEVDDFEVAVQPVPCQQCELAPCEQVCPVAATVHSREGLNDMVYNRCIGTRYCANNCPYKVRRFNYFNFHKDLEDPDIDSRNAEIAKLKYNPEVTVRSRGVMEKCTYCVQRIQAAKIEAKRTGREIGDDDDDIQIRTACQQVCPTGAIVFGDLADKRSRVHKLLHDSGRAYAMLEELNVRPRTIYLTRIRNPNSEPNEPADG